MLCRAIPGVLDLDGAKIQRAYLLEASSSVCLHLPSTI